MTEKVGWTRGTSAAAVLADLRQDLRILLLDAADTALERKVGDITSATPRD